LAEHREIIPVAGNENHLSTQILRVLTQVPNILFAVVGLVFQRGRFKAHLSAAVSLEEFLILADVTHEFDTVRAFIIYLCSFLMNSVK